MLKDFSTEALKEAHAALSEKVTVGHLEMMFKAFMPLFREMIAAELKGRDSGAKISPNRGAAGAR